MIAVPIETPFDLEEPSSIALRVKKRRVGEKTEPVIQRDWNQWVSASSTRNYLIKDPLLDWLSCYSGNLIAKKPDYATNVIKAVSGKTTKTENFVDYIMEQGNEFERQVMDYLYKRFGSDVIYDVGGNLNARSEEKFQETIEAMNKGVPIIFQGVLHNSSNQTYGAPDLIVRSDWFKKIIRDNPITREEERISALKLQDCIDLEIGNDIRPPPPYHYRIIDIKFATLKLRADGIHLLNTGSIPAYKGQLYIYNKALGEVQGYTPESAYILGRKWKYQTKGACYQGLKCDEKLGVINFTKVDKIFVEKTKEAIQWMKDLKREGSEWNIGPELPLTRKELYPNMSNQYDYPWRSIKRKMADEIKEITSLWMCGVKNREIAFQKGIYQWTDPRCTPKNIGINGPKISGVLEKILEINTGGEENVPVKPLIIQNNQEEWQNKQNIEFYVDFEFKNDVVADLVSMPKCESKSIIFMIGVGYYEPTTGWWKYREFTAENLTSSGEYKICRDFSQFVRDESEWWGVENPLLIHWSNAEVWQWKHAYERHATIGATIGARKSRKRENKIWIPCKSGILDPLTEPRWLDLLEIFRKEPIVIRGCLGFGLKDVAKTLSSLGLIDTIWDDQSSCVDGAGAMLSAHKVYKEAASRNMDPKTHPLMKDIIKYNEVDCKVVGEIINYLRENHLGVAEGDEVILYD